MNRFDYWENQKYSLNSFDWNETNQAYNLLNHWVLKEDCECAICENNIENEFIALVTVINEDNIQLNELICKSCWLYPTYKCENCDAEMEAPELCENCCGKQE